MPRNGLPCNRPRKIANDIEVYSGAPHAFTVVGSDRYRERADTKSWAALNEFFDETLKN